MNQLNPLENQLRSWTPRSPSPSLRAKLFPNPANEVGAGAKPAREERPCAPAAWHWLAPAMAVFVLGLFISGTNGTMHQMDGDPLGTALVQAALNHKDYSTYYASGRHSENNTLRSTFEWTNGSRSLRTTPPMAQTNSVMH